MTDRRSLGPTAFRDTPGFRRARLIPWWSIGLSARKRPALSPKRTRGRPEPRGNPALDGPDAVPYPARSAL